MALKIVKKTDPVKVERLKVLIYGQCGVGKTTLGFSANKPILFNFDDGVKGIMNREDFVQIKTWTDVVSMKKEDLVDYDTIVIDTLGSMQDIIKAHIISTKSGDKGVVYQGQLAQKGWGVLLGIMLDFFNLINSFDKDLVVIAHEKVEGDKESKMIDILVDGSIRGKVKNTVDLIGYIQIVGDKRIISFEPTESTRCKNRGGIAPQIEIDVLKNPHDLQDIIDSSKAYMNSKSETEVAFQARLTEVMAEIDACKDIESYQLPEDVKHDAMLKKHLQNKLDEIVMVDFRKVLEDANDAVAVNMMVDFYKEFMKTNSKAFEEFNTKVSIKYVYDKTKKQYVEKVKPVEGANE